MPRSTLGLCATSYLSVWQSIDVLEFLERCQSFGAAGAQAVINRNPHAIHAFIEKHEMYFEAMVELPSHGDASDFENSLKAAQWAGATALRAASLGSRRYETFQTIEAWRDHVAVSSRSLELALPLLERYRIPLGLENHKDWTSAEMVSLMQRYSSEFLGVCLDFGNNISLLEPPMETIEKLAPYTVSTHVKDVAVGSYTDGVLLNEVVLGTGVIDLQRAINLIRKFRPKTRFNLEMITRDPLQIPLLREDYWTTFPDASAAELARLLLFVNRNSRSPLRSSESPDENIARCFSAWDSVI